jgi:hypothetical protein
VPLVAYRPPDNKKSLAADKTSRKDTSPSGRHSRMASYRHHGIELKIDFLLIIAPRGGDVKRESAECEIFY